jgi:hypothetical protein
VIGSPTKKIPRLPASLLSRSRDETEGRHESFCNLGCISAAPVEVLSGLDEFELGHDGQMVGGGRGEAGLHHVRIHDLEAAANPQTVERAQR